MSFAKPWPVVELASIVQPDRKISYGIVQPGEHTPDGILLIRGKDYSRGWAPESAFYRVSAQIDAPYKRSKVRPGDILMTIVGANTGHVAIVPEWLDQANITQTTARIAINPEVADSRYVQQVLVSTVGKRLVYTAIKGGAQPGLNIQDVEKFLIPLPPLPVQRRIGEILATWDRAIEATEALIANGGKQQHAFAQQLLTGKARLKGHRPLSFVRHPKLGAIPQDWAIQKIGDVASEVSQRNDGKGQYPVLSCSKHDGFVYSLDYFKKQVFSHDTSNYKMIGRNQFGFPSNHIEEGSIGLQNLTECGIVSPIYCVFETNERALPAYLIKVLKTDLYRQIFAASTNASVDRRGSLRWAEFSQISIALPSVDEQAAISDAIDVTESYASTLSRDLDALRSEKAALMQQLLTGKRRVSTKKEAA